MPSASDRIHQAALRLFAERSTTQVTVSELAEAAGVARGTVYSNIRDVDSLFEDVAARLVTEMDAETAVATPPGADPAQQFAVAIRMFIRRAHVEPLWGRFLVRFGIAMPALREVLEGRARSDLQLGIDLGRFQIRPVQIPSVIAMLSGSVAAACSLVIDGQLTWRESGVDTAELFLRTIGVPSDTAHFLARSELPPLPPLDDGSRGATKKAPPTSQ